MTVIVYRDGIMAADTGVFQGDIFAGHAKKIFRTYDGGLAACTGTVADAKLFEAWATGDRFIAERRPDTVEDFGALVVKPDGDVWRYNSRFIGYPSWTQFQVEGSHEEFLSGALAAGMSAAQTVELAIRHCCWAAGDVQVEHLIEVAA